MNTVQLVGNLTNDAVVNQTKSGHSIAHFTLAINRRQRRNNSNDQSNNYGQNPQQQQDQTADFIPCEAWDALGENVAKYCGKGSRVAVTGRLNSSSYEKDGVRISRIEVICNTVEFIQTKEPGQAQGQNYGNSYQSYGNNGQQNYGNGQYQPNGGNGPQNYNNGGQQAYPQYNPQQGGYNGNAFQNPYDQQNGGNGQQNGANNGPYDIRQDDIQF